MSDQALTPQQVMEAVREMRETAKRHGDDSAEAKSRAAKVEAALETFDKKDQERAMQLQKQANEAAELKGQIQTLEQIVARQSSTGTKSYKDGAEFKALESYVKTGAIDAKSLRMDSSTEGGYLVPSEMANEIIKNITEISNVRGISRVRTVGLKTLQVPTRTAIPTAGWEGELEANDQSKSAYGNETLTCHRLGVEVLISLDLLGDAGFNMEAEINSDVAEAFAYAEGNAFVLGNGVKKPEGFAAKASLQAAARETAGTGAIAGDDILSLLGDLKVGYNPILAFNRSTLAALRKLKGTSNDHYLWQMGLGPSQPSTLGGMPYVLLQDMQSIASGNYPVVFADFRQGYMITDRTGVAVVRDPYTRAKYAQVVFNFMRWTHGQVVKDEAFKLLKIK